MTTPSPSTTTTTTVLLHSPVPSSSSSSATISTRDHLREGRSPEEKYEQRRKLLQEKYSYIEDSNNMLRNRLYHVKKEILYLQRLKRVLCHRLLSFNDDFMDIQLEIPHEDMPTEEPPRKKKKSAVQPKEAPSTDAKASEEQMKQRMGPLIESIITECKREQAAKQDGVVGGGGGRMQGRTLTVLNQPLPVRVTQAPRERQLQNVHPSDVSSSDTVSRQPSAVSVRTVPSSSLPPSTKPSSSPTKPSSSSSSSSSSTPYPPPKPSPSSLSTSTKPTPNSPPFHLSYVKLDNIPCVPSDSVSDIVPSQSPSSRSVPQTNPESSTSTSPSKAPPAEST